jgi:hypothetical protein
VINFIQLLLPTYNRFPRIILAGLAGGLIWLCQPGYKIAVPKFPPLSLYFIYFFLISGIQAEFILLTFSSQVLVQDYKISVFRILKSCDCLISPYDMKGYMWCLFHETQSLYHYFPPALIIFMDDELLQICFILKLHHA